MYHYICGCDVAQFVIVILSLLNSGLPSVSPVSVLWADKRSCGVAETPATFSMDTPWGQVVSALPHQLLHHHHARHATHVTIWWEMSLSTTEKVSRHYYSHDGLKQKDNVNGTNFSMFVRTKKRGGGGGGIIQAIIFDANSYKLLHTPLSCNWWGSTRSWLHCNLHLPPDRIAAA